MAGFDFGSQDLGITVQVLQATAHGLSLPSGHTLMGVYVDAGTGDILPADASASISQKRFFVTEIIDANTLKIQSNGFRTIPSHGYTIGEEYFTTDAGDGGFSVTPGTINDICFYVIDNNTILLIDNREA